MEMPAPPPRTPRLALAAAAVFLLVPAALMTPRASGDSGEYYLTAESLLNHGSPDLRGQFRAHMEAEHQPKLHAIHTSR